MAKFSTRKKNLWQNSALIHNMDLKFLLKIISLLNTSSVHLYTMLTYMPVSLFTLQGIKTMEQTE